MSIDIIGRYSKMWGTIIVAFIVTLLVFAYFLRKFSVRNYRVSYWHLMASRSATPPPVTSPVPVEDNVVPQNEQDVCVETNPKPVEVAEQGAKDTIAPSQESCTIEKMEDTKTGLDKAVSNDEQTMDTNTGMENSQTASEMDTEIGTGTRTDTEIARDSGAVLEHPLENERQKPDENETKLETNSETNPDLGAGSEKDEIGTNSKTDPDLGAECEQSTQNGRQKPDESGTKPEAGAEISLNSSAEPKEKDEHKSDDGGDWEIVKNERKRDKKSGAESPPKVLKSADESPGKYGLRKTKQRQQSEWEKFVAGLSKELQKMMGGYYATEDTERYLAGYPDAIDRSGLNLNLEFYLNKIKSEPDGDFIDEIHQNWFGSYDWLEMHHGYIQWLFPIQEQGLNSRAHPLQKHEIEELGRDENMQSRLIKSYELMLDFFGMKLVDKDSGKIARSDKKQKQQYQLLNTSFHNYLRITRILKCLGEFGLEHFQAPFCLFVLSEIFEHENLKNTLKSCLSYWGKVIRDFDARKEFYATADKFVQTDLARKGGIVKRELNKFF